MNIFKTIKNNKLKKIEQLKERANFKGNEQITAPIVKALLDNNYNEFCELLKYVNDIDGDFYVGGVEKINFLDKPYGLKIPGENLCKVCKRTIFSTKKSLIEYIVFDLFNPDFIELKMEQHKDRAKYLKKVIEFGANINTEFKAIKGTSILMIALVRKDKTLIYELIENGVNKEDSGCLKYKFKVQYNLCETEGRRIYKTILDILMLKNAKNTINYFIEGGDLNFARYLIKNGFETNKENGEENTIKLVKKNFDDIVAKQIEDFIILNEKDTLNKSLKKSNTTNKTIKQKHI